MKTLLLLATLAAPISLSFGAATPEPHPLRQPTEWFYYHVRLGQPANELNFLWERYEASPSKMTGAQIRQRVRELSAGDGTKKEYLPAALRSDAHYWFWSHQGPMSDRRMVIILAGDSLEKATVVFATIEERLCI